MLPRGEVGCRALNDHGNYIIDHGKIMEKSWNFVFKFLWDPCLEGKKLRVQESSCVTKQNGFLGKKRCVDAENHQIKQILALTEANWRPENIMHEVKLASMHLGGRKRALY